MKIRNATDCSSWDRCERNYGACVKHWRACTNIECHEGEWGDIATMCAAGRLLANQWKAAEAAYVRRPHETLP